jgi:hypothetical protein
VRGRAASLSAPRSRASSAASDRSRAASPKCLRAHAAVSALAELESNKTGSARRI